MSVLREVDIIVTNLKTNDLYLSRSYPDEDFDNNGRVEVYQSPVYKVLINGTYSNHQPVRKEWKALRFMPYWNDPKTPDPHYGYKGRTNSGIRSLPRKLITYYNRNYRVHNRPSPYDGGIQIMGGFLIHAGPEDLNATNFLWGGAGCVEVIGQFNLFKEDIRQLSGSSETDADEAILELVKAKKLFVTIQATTPPNYKAIGEYDATDDTYHYFP